MSALGVERTCLASRATSGFDPKRTLDPIFLLFRFEFWRPRRWQRFVCFLDLDDKQFRGLALILNFVHSAGVSKSKAQFSGAGELRTYVSVKASPFQ
jgi:hypothetical protein